jgi:arylsulfatase A-like enzyme
MRQRIHTEKRFKLTFSLLLGASLLALAPLGGGTGEPAQAQTSKPNILFVILDDVGIDQLRTFGNGGAVPPLTPNLDLIASQGVKFTNVWAMPECSPSRAAFFTGRYALRTGVDAVIVGAHLPQTYMSSFEATLPRVMTKAGYTSALVGKYHIGNEQDPAGNCAPSSRGFQYFQGSMNPGPNSVDTTAGGVDKTGSQVCGYYQTTAAGACYTAPGDSVRCTPIDASNAAPGTDPARTCLQGGGIFVPNAACRVNEPKYSDFSRTNAYYVWPRTTISGARDPLYVNTNNSCGSAIDRRYLTEAQGEDGVAWWQKQQGPRMMTLSFNTIHTPYQKPPTTLVPDPLNAASTCNNFTPPRDLLNMMIESADVEIGRVLAQLGLGTLASNGSTLTSLNLGNTMVVIIGDNGSQGAATRVPFNVQRSKGTVYQTGIWVPLIIAGPMVAVPGRSVDEMVNAVDLYHLFGSVAGVDVSTMVPPSHTLDSQPMLPYLTNPSAPPIRQTN